MKTKEELLKSILNANILQAKYAKIANEFEKEYIRLFSDYKPGQKVELIYKRDKSHYCYGVIQSIIYDDNGTFAYYIKPTKKDFTPNGRHKYSELITSSSVFIMKAIN